MITTISPGSTAERGWGVRTNIASSRPSKARAGTHNHQRALDESWSGYLAKQQALGLWVPAPCAQLRTRRGRHWRCLSRSTLDPQQRLAVDLAGARLRQLVDEFHLAPVFVRQQLCLHKIPQHLGRVPCL